MDVHTPTAVLNEAHLAEPVHEETNSRSSGAYHFGERFLTYSRDEWHWLGFLPEIGHQQEEPGQTFFA